MLTLATRGSAAVPRDERAAYRPFAVRVARIDPLSPHFTRVTFWGPDLDVHGTDGLDQRIKIVFPHPDGRLCDLGADDESACAAGSWYPTWRALPEGERNPFRTFTVRGIRPWARELDVVFATHGVGSGAGPAARWLASARPGDAVVVVGPDARSVHSATGIDFHPGEATRVLLAGDQTAAPAICAILESLPPWRRATALVEVPDARDALPLEAGPHVDLTWLPRGAEPAGARLGRAVRDWLAAHPALVATAASVRPQRLPEVDVDRDLLWEAPERAWGEDLYAWLAGEAGAVKEMRRLLVTEHGIDRRRVAFMGYWRSGRAEQE